MSDNSYHDPESIVEEIKRKTRRKFSAPARHWSGGEETDQDSIGGLKRRG